VVQASILGSILVNLLLILGMAILAGSLHNHEQDHDKEEAQGLACLLSVSVFSLLIPNAFYHTFDDDKTAKVAVLILSRVSSFTLLVIYLLYIFFQVRKPSSTTALNDPPPFLPARTSHDSRGRESSTPCILPRSIRFEDEEMVDYHLSTGDLRRDSVELAPIAGPNEANTSFDEDESRWHTRNRPDEESQALLSQARNTHGDKKTLSAQSIYHQHQRYRSQSRDSHRSHSQTSDHQRHSTSNVPRFLLGNNPSTNDLPGSVEALPEMSPVIGRKTSILLLIVSSLLVAICAELLVNTLDEMISSGPFSQAFIGLIILPIAGNCAELLTAIIVAARGNFDLAIGVSVGSSVQISLFVTPLVILCGWAMQKDMTMYFGLFEIVALFATTFLVNCLILNSRTNALEGSILCACYFIIAVGAFLVPTPQN